MVLIEYILTIVTILAKMMSKKRYPILRVVKKGVTVGELFLLEVITKETSTTER